MSRFLYAVVGAGVAAIPCGSAAAESATASVRVAIVEPGSIEVSQPLGLSSTSAASSAKTAPPRGAASYRLGGVQSQVVSTEVSETLILTNENGGAVTGRARVVTDARHPHGVHPSVINVTAEAQMAAHATPGVHTGAFRMMAHFN